jgi:hypothetical protein
MSIFFVESELIHAIDTLPADQSLTEHTAAAESQRLATPPFLCRSHLFTVMRQRAQTNKEDSEARKFVSAHQGVMSSLADKFFRF